MFGMIDRVMIVANLIWLASAFHISFKTKLDVRNFLYKSIVNFADDSFHVVYFDSMTLTNEIAAKGFQSASSWW